MAISDNEIIQRIRDGAKQDFVKLVDRYKNKGMTLAVRMLRNREDAEEALQDAFARAYSALDKFEGVATFSTWFYRILYNVCLTKLHKRKENFQTIEQTDEESELVDVGADPHAVLESEDLMRLLKNFIAEIPERYSSILSLFYFQELSYEEICEVTQLPVGTVKTHLFRARALLQKRLMAELQTEYSSLTERL